MDSTFTILARIAKNAKWPATPVWSQSSQREFQATLDLLDAYRDSTEVLYRAMNGFVSIANACYGQAGAAAVLTIAATREPGNKELWHQVSHLLESAKRLNDSVAAVGAIEINYLVALQRTDEALPKLKKLIKANPTDYWACRASMQYWGAIGDITQATVWWKKAEESAHSSRRWEQVLWRAGVLSQQHQLWQQALDFYLQLAPGNRDDAWLYLHIAQVYFAQGEYSKARAYVGQSLEHDDLDEAELLQKKITKQTTWWRKHLPWG